MSIETEAKWFIDDVAEFKIRVSQLAVEHDDDTFTRRCIFDFPDLRLDSEAAWLRVRTVGDLVDVTFKRRISEEVTGMVEHGILASSFDEACSIFLSIGMIKKSYQETRRESWRLGHGVEVTLDQFPWLPPFVEIEVDSPESVDLIERLCSTLGLRWAEAVFDSSEAMYLIHFGLPLTMENRTRISTVDWRFGDERPRFLGA